ncbi:hypothetical protein HZY86_03860 [Aerococcaceae bacterium DSM 111020]|nr:hypothetical protein [Aerococcaceae bacterium DSM 111020]
MSEYTQLERSVIEQAHQRGESAVERARQRLVTEYEDQLQEHKEQLTQKYQSKRSTLRNELEQEIQQLQNKRSVLALEAKQNVLTELYEAAVQRMNHWDREEQLTFLYKVLEKYRGNDFSLKFGEFTQQHLTEGDIQALKEQFPEMTLVNETFARQGGFVVSLDRIDYNYLYSRLVELSKEDMNLKIVQRIFEKE